MSRAMPVHHIDREARSSRADSRTPIEVKAVGVSERGATHDRQEANVCLAQARGRHMPCRAKITDRTRQDIGLRMSQAGGQSRMTCAREPDVCTCRVR